MPYQDLPREGGPCCDDALRALWAKDPDILPNYAPTPHLLDAAVVMGALWENWLRPGLRSLISEALSGSSDADACRYLQLGDGTHDIGKINPLFEFGQTRGIRPEWSAAYRESLAQFGLDPASPLDVSDAIMWSDGYNRRSLATRHEQVGGIHLNGGALFDDDDDVLTNWLPTAVSGHHGWFAKPCPDFEDGQAGSPRDRIPLQAASAPNWDAAVTRQQELIEEALGVRTEDVPPLVGPRRGAAFILISGLMMLADWIASDETWVEEGRRLIASGLDPVSDPSGWMDARRAAVEKHLDDTVGAAPVIGGRPEDFLAEYEANGFQATVLECEGRGIMSVRAPTGGGKTIAVMLRHLQVPGERLIFNSPTRAVTDAMASRIRAMLHPRGMKVVKGHQLAGHTQQAGVSESDRHMYDGLWHNRAVKRLLAQIAVVTCDQSLASVLPQRNSTLRLLATANAHNVYDEVHTFTPYQQKCFAEELRWLAAVDARVTFTSASIPQSHTSLYRTAFLQGWSGDPSAIAGPVPADFPAVMHFNPGEEIDRQHTHVPSTGEALNEYPVTPVRCKRLEVREPAGDRARWLLDNLVANPGCHAAVVANTIDETVETALRVRARLPDTHDLRVLHSRMTDSQRAACEETLLDRLGPPPELGDFGSRSTYREALAAYEAARPLSVVATSILGVSLNIDFDFVGQDLAPAPVIVQLLGRLFRFLDPTQRLRRHSLSAVAPGREATIFVPVTAKGKLSQRIYPYSTAELRAVDSFLKALPQGMLDIINDSQWFFDDTDVRAWGPERVASLTASERDEWNTAVAEGWTESSAAQEAKMDLFDHFLKATATPRYRHLSAMTTLRDDELGARTRYVDRPGEAFLLFDPRSTASEFVCPEKVTKGLLTAKGSAVADLQAFRIPVSGNKLLEPMCRAHQATLEQAGMGKWRPKTGVLKSQFPVDLAILEKVCADTPDGPQMRFDDLLGLTS